MRLEFHLRKFELHSGGCPRPAGWFLFLPIRVGAGRVTRING